MAWGGAFAQTLLTAFCSTAASRSSFQVRLMRPPSLRAGLASFSLPLVPPSVLSSLSHVRPCMSCSRAPRSSFPL